MCGQPIATGERSRVDREEPDKAIDGAERAINTHGGREIAPKHIECWLGKCFGNTSKCGEVCIALVWISLGHKHFRNVLPELRYSECSVHWHHLVVSRAQKGSSTGVTDSETSLILVQTSSNNPNLNVLVTLLILS